MKVDFSNPPDGFIVEDINGNLLIKYRRPIWVGFKILYTISLTIMICVFVSFTFNVIFFPDPDGSDIEWLFAMILFSAFYFNIMGTATWEYRSIIGFELSQEKLIVSRKFFLYVKKREILRKQITKVRQVVYENNDYSNIDFITNLFVEADKKYKILYGVGIETSDWLGLIISKWSGKDYQPWEDEVDVEI